MILIDFQRTFNTLDHKVLLQKMTCFGFKAPVIEWFESDLSNRNFFVSVDDVFSESGILNWVVPQGSTLRPLLFLIYINDLPQSLSGSRPYLYVDDTCMFYQDKKIDEIEDVLKKEFSTCCAWFVDNRLLIHFGEDRTKCILFSKIKRLSKLNIPYGDHIIEQCHTIEYLRCHFDYNLSGELWQWKFSKSQCKS